MFVFWSAGGAKFSYRTDFSEFDYANISFFDSTKKEIIFHLSLRLKTGLAVVNVRHHGEWVGEIPHVLDGLESGALVEIVFQDEDISVAVDGRAMFRSEGAFPGVESVQYLHFTGGLEQESFVLEGPANTDRVGTGDLTLGAGLVVEGWAVDPALPGQSLRLEVEGLDAPLLFLAREKPAIAAEYGLKEANIGLRATLPGRIWDAAGARDSVVVTLSSNGIVCAVPLQVSKADIVHRIEVLTAQPPADTAMFDLLLALEHVRFGALWGSLSKPAQTELHKAADTYGVRAFLDGAGESQAPVAAMAATVSPDEMLLQRVQGRFGARLAATQNPDHLAILEYLVGEVPLSPHVVRGLILAVTDAFCSAGRFADLYQFAVMRGLQTFSKADGRNWHNSVILPFLCLEGRLGEMQEVLWLLANDQNGWVVTPALGWSVRHALKTTRGPAVEKSLTEVIRAYMAFVNARNRDYWARMMCVELIDTTIDMLLEENSLPDTLQQDIRQFALRNYGLSRRFWSQLGIEAEEHQYTLPADLSLGATCFRTLEAHVRGKESGKAEAALTFFEARNNPDAARVRLELLGPTGQAVPKGASLLEGLLLKGTDPEDIVLRTMAFPGREEGTPDQSLMDIARAGIRTRHTNVPKAPYYELQSKCGRAAVAFLTTLAKDGSRAESDTVRNTLRGILDMSSTLSGAPSKYLGLGLSLSLFNGLIVLGEEDLAILALAHLSAIRSQIIENNPIHLSQEPAVHAALSTLAITAVRTGSALARSGLADFPGFDATRVEVPTDRADGVGAQGSLLFDTIVTVFSCKAYLDTRIDPMRKGWLGQLGALGIPYVVVVGDGDGCQVGDVVHLDAPDNYEGLPQKTLKAVQWVHDSTDFAYMLKVDDDCFLNVDEFFYSLSYRKFDYYGRRLHRVVGQLNRTWHFDKSQSARGRMELDKSPEPSDYADGGSGYVLSRRAMGVILRRAQSSEGQTLIHSSFMEDKMIGDLLSLGSIQVREEDYYVATRRRGHGGGVPVSMWQNSFSASRLAPMKLVHLDNETEQGESVKLLECDELYPRKIWPTSGPVRLGSKTNLLELVSDEAKLKALNSEPLAVVACLRNEMFMLPHFLAHYRKLGVKSFLIADNCSDDGTLEYLLEQPDVAMFSVDTSYGESQYGVVWQMAILANLRVGRWSLMADADELVTYKGWEKKSLPKLLASGAFRDVDAVRIRMLDMYPKGSLRDATFADGTPFDSAGYVDAVPFLRNSTGRGVFSNTTTITSALRHRLLPGSRSELFVAQKFALLKYAPWMRLSAGLHYVGDIRLAGQEMIFAHFKYNAHFRAKAEAEVARGQHFNNAEEYHKYLALVAEGREVLFDPDVSVPWQSCAEVQRILG
jgi:glycosyl transferase family 2/galactosyltransferase